jgi:uncharacterized protein (TIGR04222 family)
VSPFDLYGPQFLAFYSLVGACTLGALYLLRHVGESAEPLAINLSDPYLIAYLRGGKNEVLRLATLTLVDRGFLMVRGSNLTAASDRPPDTLRIRIEQQMIRHFASETEAASVFKSHSFDPELQAFEEELLRLDLVPGPAARFARTVRASIGILVLWAVAVIKIMVALSRGRSNIQFLIMLAIVLTIGAVAVTQTRQTRRGARMLDSLRTLFASLKEQTSTSSILSAGANPNELLLLAAVFGLETAFPYTRSQLYPKASASSSCGSSCGSGCGGGGCGGGCGGCGS